MSHEIRGNLIVKGNLVVEGENNVNYVPVMTSRTVNDPAISGWTDDSTLTGISFPDGGADGSKVYKVSAVLNYDSVSAGRWVETAFHINSAGNSGGGGAGLIVSGGYQGVASNLTSVISDWIVTPGNGHKIGVAHWANSTNVIPVGAGGYVSYITLTRIS